MKFYFLFITFFISCNIIVSQSNIDKIDNFNYNYISNLGDIKTWDSTYLFKGVNDEWELFSRQKAIKKNKEGGVLEGIFHFWDNDLGGWILKDTLTNTYYNSGLRNYTLVKPWNDEINVWKDTVSYINMDQNGNQLILLIKDWDYENNQPKAGFYYQNTYNNNNLITSKIHKSFDIENNKWKNKYKELYKYNDNNKLDTMFFQIWGFLKDWEKYRTETYIYNDLFQPKIKLVQKNKYGGNLLENEEKQLFEYDNRGNLVELLVQKWEDNEWQPKRKYSYVYNQDNKKVKTTYQKYEINTWVYSTRYFYKYNNNKDITEVISEIWSATENNWVNFHLTKYEYDDDNNRILYFQKNWNTETNQWIKNNKYVYFLSPYDPNGLVEERFDNIVIFPNPTTGIINIENESISDVFIYDETGKLLKNTTNTSSINISNLPKGLYFLEIFSNGKHSVFNIVKH